MPLGVEQNDFQKVNPIPIRNNCVLDEIFINLNLNNMGSYRQIFYQIVFGTKNRKPAINQTNETELCNYIYGIIQSKKCKLYRINGMEDHIHIMTDINPVLSLSDYVKDIKVASSTWLKANDKFPDFEGWQDGYGAFTYSIRDKDMIINYIKNQKEHHRTETFYEEYKRLLSENGIVFDEKYQF